MTMQARHFNVIAHIIATAPVAPADRNRLAGHAAAELMQTNPRFDPTRFIEACKKDAA